MQTITTIGFDIAKGEKMRRRAFLQASGSAVITWPVRAWAQKDTKLPVVAVLFPGTE